MSLARPSFLIAAFLVLAAVSSGAARVEAGGSQGHRHACVDDVSGNNLNKLLGIKERLVSLFCTKASAGEPWRHLTGWFVNDFYEFKPRGFNPKGLSPEEHLRANLLGVRYLVDPGTAHEREYSLKGKTVLPTGYQDEAGECCYIVSPPLKSLPAGTHAVRVYLTLKADHWDGFGADPAANFLPKGEQLYEEVTFEVTQARKDSGGSTWIYSPARYR